MQHHPNRPVLVAILSCLILTGCANQPDPAPTSTSPLPAWKTNTAAEAEKVVRQYFELSYSHLENGGVSPLPPEFSEYLTGSALEAEEHAQSQFVTGGFRYTTTPSHTIDDLSVYDVEDHPVNSVISMQVCFSYGGTLVDLNGNTIGEGIYHTYGIYHFTPNSAGTALQILHFSEEATDQCELQDS
jgi:hypothetical protein